MNTDILDDGVLDYSSGHDNLAEPAKVALYKSVKWGRIYFFVAVGLLLLQVVMQLAISAATGAEGGAMVGIISFVFTLGFLAVLFGYPAYKYWLFLRDTKLGLDENNESKLLSGLDGMRSVFKFLTVLLIVFLAFYILIFVGALAFGAFA